MNFYLVNYEIEFIGIQYTREKQMMVRASDADTACEMVKTQLSHEYCGIVDISTSVVRTLGYE